MKLLLALLALGLVACAGDPPLRNQGLPAPRVELGDTPFFPQDDFQCGPAALATVLVAGGVQVTPDALTPYVYLPGRQGSLQAEMLAVTRSHGRIPYVLRPELKTLLEEVAAGTPVLVMQNLGLRALPRWHYAVVIGYDALADSLLLRSGTDERLSMKRRRFDGSWLRADRWAMVAVPPSAPPPTARSHDWLRAASAFEELGQPEIAAEAYAAATVRWPQEPASWQALANARYRLDDLAGAEAALRAALRLAPSVAAHNNLAHVLLARGCLTAAAIHVGRAESLDTGVFADVVARTRAGLNAVLQADPNSDVDAPGRGDAEGCAQDSVELPTGSGDSARTH